MAAKKKMTKAEYIASFDEPLPTVGLYKPIPHSRAGKNDTPELIAKWQDMLYEAYLMPENTRERELLVMEARDMRYGTAPFAHTYVKRMPWED